MLRAHHKKGTEGQGEGAAVGVFGRITRVTAHRGDITEDASMWGC